jgi:hypothetical protein
MFKARPVLLRRGLRRKGSGHERGRIRERKIK